MFNKSIVLFVVLTFNATSITSARAVEIPSQPQHNGGIPDAGLGLSSDASNLEEGKALYENGQLIAALGKFMAVLRADSHNAEARKYLRMIVDTMRQTPNLAAGKSPGNRSMARDPAVEEEIRRVLQLRSRLTLDLKAIPSVRVDMDGTSNKVSIATPLLFDEKSGALKDQGVPVLDRVSAWLKTYGQQPVIIHCYPEELQDPATNGSLFLNRYSDLFHFFVDEKKLPAQRFVSADLLKVDESEGAGERENERVRNEDVKSPRVVIETLGMQQPLLDSMPSITSSRGMSQWLEHSITPNRKMFRPDEGEWVNLDAAALTRAGLRSWTFSITPAEGKNARPVLQMDGKGNLLKRLIWDGRNPTTGSFVMGGFYAVKLTAINSDGTISTKSVTIQVLRPAPPPPPVVEQKPKPAKKTVTNAPKKKTSFPPAAGGEPMDLPAGRQVPAPESAGDDGNEAADAAHTIWKQVIQFEPDQSELAPSVKTSLERIGKTLEVYPLQKVQILGFAMTSEKGGMELATQRAEAVRAILINEYHVDKKRVISAGGKTTSEDNGSKVELNITN